MDDAKQAPLIWDGIKLLAVVFITVTAIVIVWYLPNSVGNAIVGYFMTQATAFLAGLWGYHAIRNSRQVSQKDEWIRDCLFIHQWTWKILLMLPLFWMIMALVASLELRIPLFVQIFVFILLLFSILLGTLLYYNPLKFPVSPSVYPLGKRTPVSHCRGFSTGLGILQVLIVLTTTLANRIRGRFYCIQSRCIVL
jgi:hypothetical protein